MKLNAFAPLDKAQKVMDLLTEKQELISNNIANMDTPGYVRQDMNFANYLNSSEGIPLEAKMEEKLGKGLISREAGGAVDPAQEIANMQQNYVLYSMASRQMKSAINQIKTVIEVSGT